MVNFNQEILKWDQHQRTEMVEYRLFLLHSYFPKQVRVFFFCLQPLWARQSDFSVQVLTPAPDFGHVRERPAFQFSLHLTQNCEITRRPGFVSGGHK